MKVLRSFRRRSREGFTLIELLTVIVIIGILAGFISTAIIKAKHKASVVGRNAEIVAIDSAIRAYRYEYQLWPCPDNADGLYEENNHIIIHDWLMNNEKKIRFLNLTDFKFDSDNNIVDYKGVPYAINIDFANDNVSVY